MGYTNSPLVVYTKLSPNCSKPRNHAIDRITIHHMAWVKATVEQCGASFANANREASSNYGIGYDGRIGLYVEEKNRAWTSSSASNDNRAVTIEVANSTGAPDWKVSDASYKALIDLVTDICKRNGKTRIIWFGDKDKALNYTPKEGEMVMTIHRFFSNTQCPGSYLLSKHPDIAKRVNENLSKIPQETAVKGETIEEAIVNGDTEVASAVDGEPYPTSTGEPAVTGSTFVDPKDNDAIIWNFFKAKGFNDFAVAGLMGNLKAESNLRPDNLQNSFEGRLGSDAEYVKKIDSGRYSKISFANDHAGFGLAQWTWHTRKEALYDYAKKKCTSIADLNMQLEYLWIELQRYTKTMNVLRNAKSVYEASTIVLTDFEKPANQGNSVRNQRAQFGNEFYNKFAKVALVDNPSNKSSKLYKIQCGAFGVKANADKLASRLKKAGFDVCVRQIDTLYKVAVYGIESKKEADALASKIIISKISKATVLEDD